MCDPCLKLRSRRKIGKRKQGNFARLIRDVLNAKGQRTLKRKKHIADFAFNVFVSSKKYLQHNCARFDFLIKFSPLNFGTDATVDATS